ncbi:MAG: glycosyltransferase [Elusimicrobia bacterium]|nr:glycosyltransferase [Elusimicrobiota bacterium]
MMPATWHGFLLGLVMLSWVYWIAVAIVVACFFARRVRPSREGYRPSVSLIKPVCGLEKNLYANLSSACAQDYPDYEVVYALQNPQDPALPILERIRAENPERRVRILVDHSAAGPNGRLCNILNATRTATSEVLVYSDSDMLLPPDYLRAIVAPLADPEVGVSCTLYRAQGAVNIWESLELLSLNVEFVPSMIFATSTRAALACPGASQAVRRETLEKIGGLEPMADSLVEDIELGRRMAAAGFKIVIGSHIAATGVDLNGWRAWWRHQVYWDQNTRAASPVGFFFTWLVRGVPLAAFYSLIFLAHGLLELEVLLVTLAFRLGSAVFCSWSLGDSEGLRALWLLPLRDLVGAATWAASFLQRKIYWKGREFVLVGNRLVESA